MTTHIAPIAHDEIGEFVTTLLATPPDRLTNCRDWTVHDLVAHLAAGAAEQADLVTDRLANKPDRPTRTFAEREPAFRALPDAELRDVLVQEAARFAMLQSELGTGTVMFTGRPMTAADFAMHSRSECSIHRWDVIGRDDIGWSMLGQACLTEHAIGVLTEMGDLAETPGRRIPAGRFTDPVRVVIRSAPADDLVVTLAHGVLTVELQPIVDGPAELELDAAARLLLLWGRREPSAPITTCATGAAREFLAALVPAFA